MKRSDSVLLGSLCVVILWLITPTPLHAARAQRTPEQLLEESTHVVTGKVTKINITTKPSSSEGLGSFDYAIHCEFVVEKVEKGEGLSKGDEITVRCWRRKALFALAQNAGLFGHRPIPEPGQTVKVYLREKESVYRPVYPNGFQPVEEENISRSKEVSRLWRGFTLLFPLEVWILISLLVLVLVPVIGLLWPRKSRGRAVKLLLGSALGLWTVGLAFGFYQFFAATQGVIIGVAFLGLATVGPIGVFAVRLIMSGLRKSPKQVASKEEVATTPV